MHRRLLAGVIVTISIAIAALGLAWRPRKVSATFTQPRPAAGTGTSAAAPPPIRTAPLVLRFALADVVVLPREKHIAQGPVSIYIEDYTGGGSLAVARENGPELGRALRDIGAWRG